MDPGAESRAAVPPWSAGDGDGLCGTDHAVEHLDGEGDLSTLTWAGPASQLGPDQVLVSAYRRFNVVAPAVTGRALPTDAAPVGHELNVVVAREPPFWTVLHALTRLRAMLPPPGGEGLFLAGFLPPVPADTPDRDRRCHTAVSATILASLELASDGAATLHQEEPWQAIRIGRMASNRGGLGHQPALGTHRLPGTSSFDRDAMVEGDCMMREERRGQRIAKSNVTHAERF